MNFRILVLIIILCLNNKLNVVIAASGNDSLYFQVLNMKDGLPGSTILDFEQDALGFIWIATNDGLCRYDGVNFKVFKHEPNNKNSLWNNFVQNLYIDKNDNLWVMTTNGLNLFDLKQQILIRIEANPEQGGLLDYSPTDVSEADDGTVFISSYYNGISYRTGNEQKFHYLNDTLSDSAALSSNNINCLELLNDSMLFIGYRDSGIDIFYRKSNKTLNLEEITGSQLCSNNVTVFCNNGRNGLWIGTDAGLSYFDANAKSIKNFPYSPNDKSFIVDREILSLYDDNNGYLWIGTRRNGLVIVNQDDILNQGKKASYIQYMPNFKPGSLSYRTILKIFNDRNSHLWIGTHGGGVNLIESKHRRFGHIYYTNGEDNGLSYNKVWGITEDHDQNIWIGTDGDGINVWNWEKGVIKNYRHNSFNQSSLSDNAVISAFTDSKGQIWLGTYEGGLNRFDKQNNSFVHYKAPDALPANDIRCIYEDKNQNLWVGMNRGGIARYNSILDRFESIEITSNYDVRSIFSIDDVLWLGTYSFGLIKYDIKNNTLLTFNDLSKTNDEPLIQTIYSIYSQNNKTLWLGTDNLGLCSFDIYTGELKIYSEKNGLANNKVHAILPDKDGNLWLSTNKGISRFNLAYEVFLNYNWHKGVQAQEFHDGSKLITHSGLYCFGGIEGMNYFRPENFRDESQKPNLQFTGFTVMNKVILPFEEKIIDKSIEYRPNVKLNYEHRFFALEFQALNYSQSDDITYEYKLEGYENEWLKTGQQNIATYKNIPAGDYIFWVKCYPKNKPELSNQIFIKISMAPPIWKTIWAYLIYFLFLALVVYTIFRYRMKQYQYENRIAYEQKLREKQQKLHEERLEFFTNISHELRTPLTIIGVALEEMKPSKDNLPKLKKNYETALKNSNRLMELINKLLEFRRVERGVANLSVGPLKLNGYLSEFLQDFRQMAKHNNINLKLSLPLDELTLWIDQDKFAMILNNLLSNAIKNTPEGGQIVLSADEDEKNILVKVKDTGIGIEKNNLKKIFNRYYKVENKSTNTGIGLALTKSLVELHHGIIEVESAPNKGTRFTLQFLKGNAHFLPDQMLLAADNEYIELKEENSAVDENLAITDEQQLLLLIDDNNEILDLLHDKFIEDFKIIKASSGEEGVQLARKYSPDLIISDIMMPGISGIEVCQQLKNDSTTSHIPIILLTAKGSEKDEIEGLNTGADDYISKPFKFSILKARVNTILENRKKIGNYFESQPEADQEREPSHKLPDKELAFLNKLKEYVLTNSLSENVSVFEIASDLGFSRTSLYRKVKSLTGLSINAFVRSVKIERSVTLIEEGMNVSEAAYSVGFEDLKYFRDCFKKQIGRNPSELKI